MLLGQGTSRLKIRLGVNLSNVMQMLKEEITAVRLRPTRNHEQIQATGVKFLQSVFVQVCIS